MLTDANGDDGVLEDGGLAPSRGLHDESADHGALECCERTVYAASALAAKHLAR